MLFFAGRMATYNPWQVESIQAFYYLKCPECEFDTIEENMFEDHAIKNHPLSHELFGKKSLIEGEFDSVVIKEEQISDVDEQDNNCEMFDFHHTEMVDDYNLSEVKREPLDEQLESKDLQNIASDNDGIDQVKKGFIDKDFESEDHVAYVHEEKKPFYCFHCEQGFMSNHILKLHFESEHPLDNKCSFCPKRFGATLDLKKHLDTEHKGVKKDKNTSLNHEIRNVKDVSNKNIDHHIIKANDTRKPPMTCPQLIAEALMKASESMLGLSDIYRAINYRHPYYELDNPTWQNRISHQLSINDSFVKAEKTSTGRGCYWKLSDNLQGGVAKYLKNINPQQFDPQWSEQVTKKMKLGTAQEDVSNKDMDHHIIKANDTRKPLMTCPQLIAEALMKASESMLGLSDIYRAINYRHPYYELDNPTWQNRISHQLSINDSFVKAEKTSTGRGCYWKLSDNLQGGVAKYLKNINPQQFDPEWSEPVTKMVKLSDISQEKVKCPECQKPFVNKSTMKAHFISVHEGLMTHKERKYKFNVDEGKKPFKCSHCEEGFTSVQGLQEHFELVHEGEYLYNCSYCNKKFSSKPNLNKHTRTVHEGKLRITVH